VRGLRVVPSDATPIWRQIEDGVRRLVATGGLAPGQAVPSVRDLARELRVNPATVSKAYQRLSESGLLTVRRGDGTYVNEAPPALTVRARQRTLAEAASRYAAVAATLGARLDEAQTELRSVWERLDAARGGK
jgi:GntR family transcriptional regulator